jgi:DeoR family transcriptional regulator, ulaG and ulaABCDEF operon transcriptional repressor
MINHQRHKRLLKLLEEHGEASTEQLMDWLAASAATVRRDLGWLAARQQITRTRGGARRLQQPASGALRSQAFQDGLCRQAAQKRAIARHAAGLCETGETVIINGGTTTFMMAEFLAQRQLRILTNSFLLAERLLATSDNQIILPGGSIYREQNVIVSPFEDDVARHHYAAKMFMGVHGLCALGLMEADPLLVQAERRLIAQAEQLVVLVDSSKFSHRAGLVLCGLDRVACVITDTGAPDAVLRHLERQGVRVVTVAPDGDDALHGVGRSLPAPRGAARALIPARPGVPAPSRAG